MQYGGVCKNCKGYLKCDKKPTGIEPLIMDCVVCSGNGCDECNESGIIEITDCPLVLIPKDVWEAIEFADLYEKGLPPIAGGSLDQMKSFVLAANFIFKEKAYWKKKLGIIDGNA